MVSTKIRNKIIQEFDLPSNSNSRVKNWVSNWVSKNFGRRVRLNCESKNVIYAVLCLQWLKEKTSRSNTKMLKEGLNAYRQYIRKPELQHIDEKSLIRTCGCYYYFYSHTRNRFYWVTFKLEDIHRPKFCTITVFYISLHRLCKRWMPT